MRAPACYPLVVWLLLLSGPVRGGGAETVDFARDIRPILSHNCFRCHGPDADQRQANLRLDLRASALGELKSGGRAIAPGEPAASQLWLRITSADPAQRMPPANSGKVLAADERERIGRWIQQGATWNEHWSLMAPVRPRLPTVRRVDWARNAIDRFVLARLEAMDMGPSAEATRETLVRRLTQELTGLPPTPAEVDAYLADTRPDAYERLVDRLLQSPRYGEHRARYWLDVARYGDTHGLHLDNERSLWPYRDWVINALNHNQPFDQFTIEQLAGDLLPNARLDQRVATGFNRCNVTTSEGGSIDEEYLVRYAVDRVETTATTWMGLTAGCAVCHDHKFDPLSQTEFYRLFAYFFSLTERAMDGNALLPPPTVKVPTITQLVEQQRLRHELQQVQSELQAQRQQAQSQLAAWIEDYRRSHPAPPVPDDWLVDCPLDELSGQQVQAGKGVVGTLRGSGMWDAARVGGGLRLDGQGHVDLGDQAGFDLGDAFSAGGWIYIDDQSVMTVLSRMDDAAAFRGYDLYLGDGRLFVHLIHQWDGNALRVNTRQPLVRQKWQHVFFTYDGSRRASGVTIYLDGQPQDVEITHDKLTATIRTEQPLRIGQRSAAAPFVGMLDEIRVYGRELTAEEVQGLAGADSLGQLLRIASEQRTAEQQQTLTDFFLTQRQASFRDLLVRERELRDRARRLEGQFPSTLVMEDMSQPRQAHVLIRGQYDQPGAVVSPGVPAALPPLPQGVPANRLALARWLVDPAHPLTARVTVNRLWQQFFGIGIVATAEDFGSQGEWPSHPELLDWLAVEFRQSGWDVKALVRLMVTSATYRQSSVATPERYRRDPQNRWLARGPRFRLDAEMIRDHALALSGLLVERLGGRSVKPYQPEGLWEAVGYTSSNTARFTQDHGQALYRRSLYTFWKRTSPPPTMQILDAPSREVCTARRPRTNTPTAALALMNDVQMIEAARHLASRIWHETAAGADDVSRLRYGFRLVTSREPTPIELDVLHKLLADYRAEYQQDRAGAQALASTGESPVDDRIDVAELAAWTLVGSTLLNLDETVTKH